MQSSHGVCEVHAANILTQTIRMEYPAFAMTASFFLSFPNRQNPRIQSELLIRDFGPFEESRKFNSLTTKEFRYESSALVVIGNGCFFSDLLIREPEHK